MSNFIPSRLYKVKIFESQTYYHADGQGRLLLSKISTPSLEDQVNAWVDQTKNLITGTGPVMAMVGEVQVDSKVAGLVSADEIVPSHMTVELETRTLPVTYVPAVEQGDGKPQLYGETTQQRRPTGGEVGAVSVGVKPTGSLTDQGSVAAQPGSGRRGTLRVPTVL